MVTEGDGRNDRDDSSGNEAVHPARQMIRERDDGWHQTEGGHTWLKLQSVFFYKDSRMITSTNTWWLQTAYDMLKGLFDWVRLKKHLRKTVGMVYHTCWAVRVRADKAYTQRMTGLRRDYKERQRERVGCPKCGKYMARGSLATHCQTQHMVVKKVPINEKEGGGGGNKPRTYRIAFPTSTGLRHCPVEGCSGQAEIRVAMRVQFWHRHVWDTVVIL